MKAKRKTKVKDKSNEKLTDGLNEFAECAPDVSNGLQTTEPTTPENAMDAANATESEEDKQFRERAAKAVENLFDRYESEEFCPRDLQTEISVDSLESNVGYTSLLRQMHTAFVRRVAFYRTPAGGSLSVDEARAEAFHACVNREEATKIFDKLLSLPLDCLNFVDLQELYSYAPRAAEGFWEMAKGEAANLKAGIWRRISLFPKAI